MREKGGNFKTRKFLNYPESFLYCLYSSKCCSSKTYWDKEEKYPFWRVITKENPLPFFNHLPFFDNAPLFFGVLDDLKRLDGQKLTNEHLPIVLMIIMIFIYIRTRRNRLRDQFSIPWSYEGSFFFDFTFTKGNFDASFPIVSYLKLRFLSSKAIIMDQVSFRLLYF